jgi:hypothetical protein
VISLRSIPPAAIAIPSLDKRAPRIVSAANPIRKVTPQVICMDLISNWHSI